ncbi:MAG: SIR2 family protein [Shimia sp.]|uniref:SIR2 family protein n=1 Tax=Shimia sp. TaxID=1954381 RepID=UPI003B8DA154
MPVSFFPECPEFPDKLVNELIKGEVVVLCGAGISAPQLELFKALTSGVFEDLSVVMSAGEIESFEAGRYEEVLGSLARRLAQPEKVQDSVCNRLRKPDKADLSQHRTLLRLSKDVENRSTIVTTNFETLLEHAHGTLPNDETVDKISFAGQALPAPGSSGFHGIVHLHGRLDDQELNLRRTPLVLTSSDYGEAYMRSGWASRFLFDLSRCRTILLVGYSAGDAPVRYFLNVLESDRSRFSDLRSVYALASYEKDPVEVHKQWATLGVEPIPYPKKTEGKQNHFALWQGLSDLADLIERPQKQKKEIISDIVSKDFRTSSIDQQNMVIWLLSETNDVWDCVIRCVEDPKWFEFIRDNKLWPTDLSARIVAFWLEKNFQCPKRFEFAVNWLQEIGAPLVASVQERLRRNREVQPDWRRVWRLFCKIQFSDENQESLDYFELADIFDTGELLDSDIVRAVSFVAPGLRISRRLNVLKEFPVKGDVKIGNLCYARLEVNDTWRAKELSDRLIERPELALRTVEVANFQLRQAISLEVELGHITNEFDLNDTSVPAIEDHEQNEHRDGILYLIRLIIDCFPAAIEIDPDGSMAIARSWLQLPGNIGLRLYLHAARTMKIIDPNEAIGTLLRARSEQLWACRREVALFIRDQAICADRDLVEHLEARFLLESPTRFRDADASSSGTDWRPIARDRDLWIYLSMLEKAGVLSDPGQIELKEIRERREFHGQEVEERDLFRSFSFGVQRVVGREEPIRSADPEQQLHVAQEMLESPNLEDQQGWSTFCQSDPAAALQALKNGDFSKENLSLWSTFLSGISFAPSKGEDPTFEVLIEALEYLENCSAEELTCLSEPIVSIIFHRRKQLENVRDWWWKIWPYVTAPPLSDSRNLMDFAVNTAHGKLAEVALFMHSNALATKSETSDAEEMLATALAADGAKGLLTNAILVRNVSYLMNHCEDIVVETLEPNLKEPTATGLRSVFIQDSRLSAQAFSRFKEIVDMSLCECSEELGRFSAENTAAQVLRPALSLAAKEDQDWGVSAQEITKMLRNCPASVRAAMVHTLYRWTAEEGRIENGEGAEGFSEAKVLPLFAEIWPKESEYVDELSTQDFLRLLVVSGSQAESLFPVIQAFIAPYRSHRIFLGGLPQSDIPTRAPKLALRMIWHVLKASNKLDVHEVGKVLDAIVESDPNLEFDRRFQQLEAKTLRI